jgi:AcrR family transcriptional regulator
VARTRSALQQAHLRLIVRNGYDSLTVEDVCREADVGRSTFYAHYSGIDDLKRSGLENLRRMLSERQPSVTGGCGGELFAFSLPMFEHAREHLDLYRALVGSRGGVIAIETIRRSISELVRADLASDAASDAPRELVVQHLTGAYMAVLTWWLDAGATIPPREMDAMFRRLALEGLASTPGATRADPG